MGASYFDAIRDGLQGVLDLVIRIALPIGIFLGLLLAAAILIFALKGGTSGIDWAAVRKVANKTLEFLGIGLLVVCLWSGLKEAQPKAREDIEWRESAEASANPAPEAPPIDQYGPVAARMVEKTYTRTLTLPPDFLQRIGTDSIGALAPYLTDPTAENVLKLVDSFKKSGSDVVFSRELTRLDEDPIPFDSSDIRLTFHRLQEQAFDVDTTATYTFSNPDSTTMKGRFLFTLPQSGGTVQDLKISVGGQDVPEPDERGAYVWQGDLAPGEKKQAVIHYKSIGERTWSYDLGSNRRRVKSFALTAAVDGPIQFRRGSILPTSKTSSSVTWNLANVVTSQQIALQFPPDIRVRDAYLQGLSMLPPTLILLALGLLVVSWRIGTTIPIPKFGFALIAFSLGLGATAVLANYLTPIVALFVGPLLGAYLCSAVVGWRYAFAAVPIALLPATALSPTNTGLWVLGLALVGLFVFVAMPRLAPKA